MTAVTSYVKPKISVDESGMMQDVGPTSCIIPDSSYPKQ